jgi:hypothetical protein
LEEGFGFGSLEEFQAEVLHLDETIAHNGSYWDNRTLACGSAYSVIFGIPFALSPHSSPSMKPAPTATMSIECHKVRITVTTVMFNTHFSRLHTN